MEYRYKVGDVVSEHFEVGVVVSKTIDHIDYIVLYAVEREDPEDAFDSDQEKMPPTVDDQQWRLDALEKEGGFEDYCNDRTTFLSINKNDKSFEAVAVGSVVHKHNLVVIDEELSNGWRGKHETAICVNLCCLSQDQTEDLKRLSYENRTKELREKISDLEGLEEKLPLDMQTVQMGETFRLFDNVEIKEGRHGGLYMAVPDRVLVGGRFPVQVITVRSRPFYATDASDIGLSIWTVSGNEYLLKDIFPFDEVDDDGVPHDLTVPRMIVEVSIYNPYRKVSRATEEQKIQVQVGGSLFQATANPDMLVGNQGYGGVDYDGFHSTENTDPYYKIVTAGAPGLKHIPYGNRIVVPVDIALAGEIEAMFPGS